MENVSKAAFDGRSQVVDERFARDKERLDTHEVSIRAISELSSKMSQILEQNKEQLDNHERRLDKQESKPSAWLDRIISGVLGAVIAALVAAVMSGRI